MNRKPPSPPKLHSTGQWCVRWGGRTHYLGTDRDAAVAAYPGEVEAWARWRRERDARMKAPPLTGKPLTVETLKDRFLASRLAEGGEDRKRFYQKHLGRFVLAYASVDVADVRPVLLQRLKDVMLAAGKAARTINHDIQAVKTMLQWAVDLELAPPINLRGVRKIPTGEPPDKTWPVEYVRQLILKDCTDKIMRAWLACNYLCAMRPIEVVRAVNGQGSWESKGVMRLPNKMGWKTGTARRVLFSDEAARWLRRAKPRWSRLDSYSQAVRDALGVGPHRLRHSAGLHLLQAGVPREDADCILGHLPRAVSRTYMPVQWQHLRTLAAKLTLKR